MNRMADLREEVAARLRRTLHGKEIDMIEGVRPRLPHMLGITPLDEAHDPQNEDDSILDPKHRFWEEYEESIKTRNQAERKVETAIQSLEKDGILEISYPHGEEAEIAYVEVEQLSTPEREFETSCKKCDTSITTEPSLTEEGGHYHLQFSIDCPSCDFSGIFQRTLHQL